MIRKYFFSLSVQVKVFNTVATIGKPIIQPRKTSIITALFIDGNTVLQEIPKPIAAKPTIIPFVRSNF
jgi:hypothetical protein